VRTDVVWLAAHVDKACGADSLRPTPTACRTAPTCARRGRPAGCGFPVCVAAFRHSDSHSHAPLSSSLILTLQAPRADCWIRVRASGVGGQFCMSRLRWHTMRPEAVHHMHWSRGGLTHSEMLPSDWSTFLV
jgi:hypothetical protein